MSQEAPAVTAEEVYFDCPIIHARLSISACERNRQKQFLDKQRATVLKSACDQCADFKRIQEESAKASKQQVVKDVTGVPTHRRPYKWMPLYSR